LLGSALVFASVRSGSQPKSSNRQACNPSSLTSPSLPDPKSHPIGKEKQQNSPRSSRNGGPQQRYPPSPSSGRVEAEEVVRSIQWVVAFWFVLTRDRPLPFRRPPQRSLARFTVTPAMGRSPSFQSRGPDHPTPPPPPLYFHSANPRTAPHFLNSTSSLTPATSLPPAHSHTPLRVIFYISTHSARSRFQQRSGACVPNYVHLTNSQKSSPSSP